MSTLLIKDAQLVATFDNTDPAKCRELSHTSAFVSENMIEAIGPAAGLPHDADEVINARGPLVMPELVNTHHHMYQSLSRAMPATQNAELFGWLRGLYPIRAGLTPKMVQVSTQVATAELLMSGCTTSSDHLYIYPNGVRLDAWRCLILARWHLPAALYTTLSVPCFCAPASRLPVRLSTARSWCGKAGWSRLNLSHWWNGTTSWPLHRLKQSGLHVLGEKQIS